MLKFIKHHMTTIDGIELFPLISFLIFFIFFLGLFVHVFKMKKAHVEDMSNMPLSEEPVQPRQNQ
ncbi:CcoQ/FixQ family Cbb3-type cytochrome c oxidase assembly chaperone [Sanyastnella coralliicola]|uniref:CcoQ/FixQ family Cbb3-type cytochrome c oxidase assembly chaperone n=1 Tax=Sanyastnella coralliicola TaxID=3069118 RepID=UPI0027BB195F|nr:CcoQ/FixQ family Cbb3-type cytochrome c oxidase assembly chaperone [Longitalea sp. SCSIO 12813]